MEGRIRTRKWQDQNGQDRYTTEIHGDDLQMLDRAGAQGAEAGFGNASSRSAPPPAEMSMNAGDTKAFDDDIPF